MAKQTGTTWGTPRASAVARWATRRVSRKRRWWSESMVGSVGWQDFAFTSDRYRCGWRGGRHPSVWPPTLATAGRGAALSDQARAVVFFLSPAAAHAGRAADLP